MCQLLDNISGYMKTEILPIKKRIMKYIVSYLLYLSIQSHWENKSLSFKIQWYAS